LRLDKSIESRLFEVVRTEFPKTATLDWRVNKIADTNEIVARDSYELQIRHDDIDYERRWRIKSSGDFGSFHRLKDPVQLISDEVAGATNAVALAELESNTVELQTSPTEIIANALNQIVRCLGYSTRLGTIEDEIKHLLSYLEAWKKRPDMFCIAPHPSSSFLSNAPDAAAS